MEKAYEKELETLRRWIEEAKNVVFFGGAGVSTESGIPDFRSVDGLYHQKYEFPPETIISRSFFERNPEVFYRFYREKLNVFDAEPNAAHLTLARLEREGKVSAVITQNIDGLHQKAGSRTVYELHGTLLKNYCARCRRPYPADHIMNTEGIPRCSCGGLIRPDIVLYEEGLDDEVVMASIRAIRSADVLIIGGTSLVVYPAAGLVNYYTKNRLVLINRDATPMDSAADLILRGNIGEILGAL